MKNILLKKFNIYKNFKRKLKLLCVLPVKLAPISIIFLLAADAAIVHVSTWNKKTTWSSKHNTLNNHNEIYYDAQKYY